MIIRKIEKTDSGQFLELCRRLDEETKFMLFEPGERKSSVEQTEKMISSVVETENSSIFVCEYDGRLIGQMGVMGGRNARNRHSGYIVVGILQEFAGKGIGTKFFQAAEEWAKSVNITRLELTVMTHNEQAVALYKKMGFEIEGRKVHSLIVDGQYVDEYYMGKLI